MSGESGGSGYLPLTVVVEATQGLLKRFGRLERTAFEAWLFAKWRGMEVAPGGAGQVDQAKSVLYTNQDCADFQRAWFEVDCPGVTPPNDDRGVFDPFKGEYAYRSGRTQWHIQTFATQLDRPSTRVRRVLTIQPDEGGRRIAPAEHYLEELTAIVGGKVSLVDLAVWRYRHDPLADGTTFDDLVEQLWSELHLSETEASAVFVDAPPHASQGPE